jgi:hypothetical protein
VDGRRRREAGGVQLGKTDELGFNAVEDKVHVHDLNATILHLFGFDHTKLTYRFQGRDFRLTDVIPGLAGFLDARRGQENGRSGIRAGAHERDRILAAADVLEVGMDLGDAAVEGGFDLFEIAGQHRKHGRGRWGRLRRFGGKQRRHGFGGRNRGRRAPDAGPAPPPRRARGAAG